MEFDVNGYNATFRKFAEFAQTNMDAGHNKAVASASASPRNPRVAVAVSASRSDKVGAMIRSAASKSANNTTRSLFITAVADMFGGMNKVPDSVFEKLLATDYGEGKPLTARRIMAVKDAIDACGIPRRRAEWR